MPTANLEIPYLGQNVAQPEIPENEAKDIIDAAICGQLYIDMAVDTDYTIDDTNIVLPQEWQYSTFIINPVAHTANARLLLPDGKRMKYVIVNNSGNAFQIRVKTVSGDVGFNIDDGEIRQVITDGTTVKRIS